MAFDINKLAALARARYLDIGRRYRTAAVLAQANKILRALELYAAQLARHGFGPRDHERIRDGRDALLAYETGRSQTATERKVTSQSNDAVVQSAREARQGTRAVLAVAGDEALEQGANLVFKHVDTVLDQTSVQPDADVQLLDQLEALHAVLIVPEVSALVEDRGGPETLSELVTARADLTTLVNERGDRSMDPAMADDRDVVDGYVVTLARRARAAARVAARRLGQPAIAEAFKLTHLHSRSGGGATEPEAPDSDDPVVEPVEPPKADEPTTLPV